MAWELRAKEPMVPMGLFRKRTFAVTNAVSFFMYFGTFGSIFLLTQVLQYVLGYTPFQAGVRMLLWTGATMIVAPIAGVLSERIGSRGFMAAGLALQAGALAWFAATTSTSVTFGEQAIAFVMAGAGMGLVFAPSASALLSVVSPAQAGQASGTNNAIREVGGVFGVAVLATVFSESGAFTSPQGFVDGVVPALWVASAVVALGAVVALALPRRARRTSEAEEAVTAGGRRVAAPGLRRARRSSTRRARSPTPAPRPCRRARSCARRATGRAADLLEADVGPRGAQADAVLDDPSLGQPGLDRGAAADDLLGQRGVGLEAPVVVVGAAAQHDVVAMREPPRPARRRLLHEELVQARVLDDHVLAAHRADGGVGHQRPGAHAAAVDDHRGRARHVGQRAQRAHLEIPSGRLEAGEQVVEVARHVDQRHVDREGGDEARRGVVAADDVDAGEEELRRPLLGAARGEHPARDAHARAGLAGERAQVVEALKRPAADVGGRPRERRAPHRARRARGRLLRRRRGADAHLHAALGKADRAGEPDHAGADDERVSHRCRNLSSRPCTSRSRGSRTPTPFWAGRSRFPRRRFRSRAGSTSCRSPSAGWRSRGTSTTPAPARPGAWRSTPVWPRRRIATCPMRRRPGGEDGIAVRTAALGEAQPSLRPVTELVWERDGLYLRLTAQGPWEIDALLALARSV